MTVPEHAVDTDPNQEHDVWWGCCAGRSLAPSFVFCGLLTVIAIILFVHLWFDAEKDQFITWHITLITILLVWLCQFLRWLYYLAGHSYRLTNRNLYHDVRFSRLRSHFVGLTQVHSVVVRKRPHEQYLGTGRIEIYLRDSARPAMVLSGLRAPEDAARLIRRWIGLAKETEAVHGAS